MKTVRLIVLLVLLSVPQLRADDKPAPVERTVTEEPAKSSEQRIAELERRVKALEERLERLTKEPVVAEPLPRTSLPSNNDDRERFMSLSEDAKGKFRQLMMESREKIIALPVNERKAYVRELFEKLAAEDQQAKPIEK